MSCLNLIGPPACHLPRVQGGQALVDNENCVILSQHLRGNNTLETLDLDSNDIGDSGAAALASLLVPRERGGCCLTYLGLRNNLIGVPGAEALAKSLTQNSTLVDLDLRLNAIEGMGVYCVLTSLVSNQTIESLLLGENVRCILPALTPLPYPIVLVFACSDASCVG